MDSQNVRPSDKVNNDFSVGENSEEIKTDLPSIDDVVDDITSSIKENRKSRFKNRIVQSVLTGLGACAITVGVALLFTNPLTATLGAIAIGVIAAGTATIGVSLGIGIANAPENATFADIAGPQIGGAIVGVIAGSIFAAPYIAFSAFSVGLKTAGLIAIQMAIIIIGVSGSTAIFLCESGAFNKPFDYQAVHIDIVFRNLKNEENAFTSDQLDAVKETRKVGDAVFEGYEKAKNDMQQIFQKALSISTPEIAIDDTSHKAYKSAQEDLARLDAENYLIR